MEKEKEKVKNNKTNVNSHIFMSTVSATIRKVKKNKRNKMHADLCLLVLGSLDFPDSL